MAQVKPVLRIELDPLKPVPEICAVIMAVTPYHAENQEESILQGVKEALDARLNQLKGADTVVKQIREPNSNKKDK